MERKFKIKIAIFSVLFLGAIFSFYFANRESRTGILTVAFLDVGQGDSIFIEAPNGNQMLIDGGVGRGVLRELGKVMPFYDKSIDVVLATHPDADHIGGLNDVLERYRVDLFMESGVESDTSVYKELESRILNLESNRKIKKIEARSGMIIDLGSGVLFEILYPIYDTKGMESNTASIVGRLIYGENSFILTGDSPKNIEEYLVSLECRGQPLICHGPEGLPSALGSNVLKAGHHGSKTSTSDSFVFAISPQYAVISSGKNNRYGHPHQEVLDILEKYNVQVLNTADLGRIIFKSDGNRINLISNYSN
jgi:competence protein ComEC